MRLTEIRQWVEAGDQTLTLPFLAILREAKKHVRWLLDRLATVERERDEHRERLDTIAYITACEDKSVLVGHVKVLTHELLKYEQRVHALEEALTEAVGRFEDAGNPDYGAPDMSEFREWAAEARAALAERPL